MNENGYSRREFVGAGLTAGAGLTTGLLIPRAALASTPPVTKDGGGPRHTALADKMSDAGIRT
jgi:hypothetical protein